ncbi:MAG: citrate synthase [Verrucomicrobiota bacterium]
MAVTARGLEGIVAAETRLSDVRGQEGVLIYCGYNINELAGKASYEEVIYLLYHDKLPNRRQLTELKEHLRELRELPEGVVQFIKNAPKEASPIDVMRTAISMLGLYDTGEIGESPLDINRERALSIVAKIGVIVGYFHRARQGLDLPKVRKDLDEAAHFLYLITGKEPGPEATRTLDVAYVLHADHGFNASTFTARVVVSTLTDMYSAITAAIGALKGPLHGGANEGVIKMLHEIGEQEQVDAYIEQKLAQKQKIMGIGHRVYKVLDPRAPHLKVMATKLSQEIGEEKWVKMSERIAEIMKERKGLNANVDFYSATVYYSLGIPPDLFTPIFAIARSAGWTAHVLEQLSDNRLFRPMQDYVGHKVGRTYTPLEER